MPAMLPDTVDDLVMAAGKLRADDRLITDPAAQLEELDAIVTTIRTLQAVAVRRVADCLRTDATSDQAGMSTRAWLVEDQRMCGGEAGRYKRLAASLPFHPLTQAAMDAAEISMDHAAAILTALSSLPIEMRATVEPHLVERAKGYPPEEIGGFIDQLLEALGLDKASDVRRERRFTERGLDLTPTMDGHRAVGGSLTPEVAERLDKALAIAAQRAGADDDRTLRQRQHDALGEIADAYLAQTTNPSFTGAPRTVIVTIDLETLENQLREKWLTLPSGAQISAETARRLACDAELIPVVLGGASELLDIGQAGHDFSVATRRLAWLRDAGRCAFPHCRNKPRELHHIRFKRHGGAGTLDNGAWLCGYHHWLVHEGGWSLERTDQGDYLWTGPHGQQRRRHL